MPGPRGLRSSSETWVESGAGVCMGIRFLAWPCLDMQGLRPRATKTLCSPGCGEASVLELTHWHDLDHARPMA